MIYLNVNLYLTLEVIYLNMNLYLTLEVTYLNVNLYLTLEVIYLNMNLYLTLEVIYLNMNPYVIISMDIILSCYILYILAILAMCDWVVHDSVTALLYTMATSLQNFKSPNVLTLCIHFAYILDSKYLAGLLGKLHLVRYQDNQLISKKATYHPAWGIHTELI